MTRKSFHLWLLIVVFASACGAMQPQPGVVTGVVHGVKHYDSPKVGPPVENREITLIDSDDGNIQSRTKTDADGKFSFSVPPGKYSVWGGERAEYVRVAAGTTTTVDITAPER
jgi:hypothetical protein